MSKKAQKLYIELNAAIAKLPDPVQCSEPHFQDWFFTEGHIPTKGVSTAAIQSSMRIMEISAKRICALCPVKALCAEYAITAKEEFGVWGGMTPLERRAISASKSTMLED